MGQAKPHKPIVLNANDITSTASERFPDPSAGGDVSWRTLISAPKTRSNSFTVGIATCAPGVSAGCQGHLKPHRHKQAELYHFTSGKGIVTIDGVEYQVSKGSVVWIPGDAEHGVRNLGGRGRGGEDLVWLYAFATDAFEDVVYRFSEGGKEAAAAANIKAKL
ncbi:hypothetical protein COCMIDRAFT_105354 [Bipolaris oryzae ATCC 44560]|uniref:Cupin type-2 domain-containing protein n=1 Tax=Bipolaris oryzae ATCC 44560 TaxID=930090 RepID=W6Z282_COCMI|nr:uncharacterized protein COCMIDRAFT_105354 [Bipolaris oryzae ATCC 44560]EUC41744.1 hypothetical protein COCMIDRAFT_105354 [Bipolaris oryzae ATCC 44560]